GVEDLLVGPAGADGDHEAGLVAGPDEDVLGPGRAMHEVPRLEAPLLALDEQDAFAREDEEVLLLVLAVVVAVGLARLDDPEVEAELLEPGVALERDVPSELGVGDPLCLAGVDDVPAL